jgi:hypothetical protein
MTKTKILREILENPPQKRLTVPIEEWYDDGKSCDVHTTEIDYGKWITQIKQWAVDRVPKEKEEIHFETPNKYGEYIREFTAEERGHNSCRTQTLKNIKEGE